MKHIGFIGVGVMGKSMVLNLIKHGYDVTIFTRTQSKVTDILSQGAHWAPDAACCAGGQEAIITMVGYPKDVEQVYFGPSGIIENAAPGAYLIDMTTTDPSLSQRIAAEAQKKGLFALDAPVSGGDVGAKNGTLSIMAGGDKEAYNACLPLFEAMGKTICYQGGPGYGQHTKMANQIALGGAIAGVCEAISYAEHVGLDVQAMLDAISQGAAGSWQMSNMAPRILQGDFDPGFFIKHYIKDMNIALSQAEKAGLHMEVLSIVRQMYQTLSQQGKEDLGTQALIQYYQR